MAVQARVQGISEAFLLPVLALRALRALLALPMAQFPFEIQGFDSNNGSECINGRVARLREKLRIEQSESRSRHSIDNALAEIKYASVVRAHMGSRHIPQKYAQPINALDQRVFNHCLNLHRPCLLASDASDVISPKGKVTKRHRLADAKTPLACLRLLCDEGLTQLQAGLTRAALQALAGAQTDLAAAQQMQRARAELLELCDRPSKQA